jgi:DNA-binding transcriptional MocR family regulator
MAFRKSAKKVPKMFTESQERAEEGRIGTMRMADDMRNLAQEIANSFDTRVATVATLRQETAAMLKGFRQEMKNVQHELRQKAADLKRFLGNAAASRMSDFRAMHQGIRARQEERNREVGDMMGGFRQEREAAASQWQNMAATMLKRRASATR